MKVVLVSVLAVTCLVSAEPPAPYPPSGYRPNGPAFELPQKNTRPQYLPPLDPRRPLTPEVQYGTPDVDVSVQGLPGREEEPIFQGSPINGQQYNGPSINTDIRNLDSTDRFRQNQYQQQQEIYRELERQRQFEAAQARDRGTQTPTPQVPRQFAQNTPGTTEPAVSTKNAEDSRAETTTELNLNEGEILDDGKSETANNKVSVEVSKQNLQEYPSELYLNALAQLQLQSQVVPFQQFGQLREPLYYQPIQQADSQNQVAGYDAATHFAALPSVLAQRQSAVQTQGFIPQGANPAYLVTGQEQPGSSYQPQPFVNTQYQPQDYQPVVVPQVVSQPNQFSRQPESEAPRQDQFVFQQSYQPQEVIYQQQGQNLNQFQPPQPNYILPQAQLVSYPNQIPQAYQNGLVPQQFLNEPMPQVFQVQGSQQGVDDTNQQDNGVEGGNDDDSDVDQDDGTTAVAVATAFGTRTQPRVYTTYGAPAPIPRVAATEAPTDADQNEQATENPEAIAVANAVATNRRKSSKLRSRRVRPVFTLDRSGHLVLAQEQN